MIASHSASPLLIVYRVFICGLKWRGKKNKRHDSSPKVLTGELLVINLNSFYIFSEDLQNSVEIGSFLCSFPVWVNVKNFILFRNLIKKNNIIFLSQCLSVAVNILESIFSFPIRQKMIGKTNCLIMHCWYKTWKFYFKCIMWSYLLKS